MSDLGWKYLTSSDKEAILRGVADGTAYGGPYHVEIHPADRCNIECFFCSTAAIRGTDELPMTRLEEMIAELRQCGTRAIRLSGGGEPLFHRKIKEFLVAVEASGIPIENLTTNAVLLSREIAEILVRCCDHVMVSLNTVGEESYASMMKTPARNYHRILENIRTLIEVRDGNRSRRPHLSIQFLPWKENYKTIPAMYRLARDLDVDSIVFNGVAWLRPDQKMTPSEIDEMLALYETVVREDEYRTISVINSFEVDLSARIAEMNDRLAEERARVSPAKRLLRLLTRRDYTLAEKLRHRRAMARVAATNEANRDLEEFCLIGWHSLLVRSTGEVAPCCILQGSALGNVFRQSVREVWFGEAYQKFRGELARIMKEGDGWSHDPSSDRTVDPLCGAKGACPMSTFWYRTDLSFMREYNRALPGLRT